MSKWVINCNFNYVLQFIKSTIRVTLTYFMTWLNIWPLFHQCLQGDIFGLQFLIPSFLSNLTDVAYFDRSERENSQSTGIYVKEKQIWSLWH